MAARLDECIPERWKLGDFFNNLIPWTLLETLRVSKCYASCHSVALFVMNTIFYSQLKREQRNI